MFLGVRKDGGKRDERQRICIRTTTARSPPPIHFPTQQSNTKSKRLISTLQHKLNTSTLPAFHLEPLFVRMVVEIRNGGEVGFGARGGGGMEIGKS